MLGIRRTPQGTKQIYVQPYVRADGEHVAGYWRDEDENNGLQRWERRSAPSFGGHWFGLGEKVVYIDDKPSYRLRAGRHEAFWKALYLPNTQDIWMWFPRGNGAPHHDEILHKARLFDAEAIHLSGYGPDLEIDERHEFDFSEYGQSYAWAVEQNPREFGYLYPDEVPSEAELIKEGREQLERTIRQKLRSFSRDMDDALIFAGAKHVKSRTWVDPYMRDNELVEGYWRLFNAAEAALENAEQDFVTVEEGPYTFTRNVPEEALRAYEARRAHVNAYWRTQNLAAELYSPHSDEWKKNPRYREVKENEARLEHVRAESEAAAGGAIYRLPAGIQEAETRIKTLAKRAEKLGLEPPTLTVVGDEWVEKRKAHVPVGMGERKKFTYVAVKGDTPKIAGWDFLASVQHINGSNVLRRVPGSDENIDLDKYRDADPRCDHCGKMRNRKDTFIVKGEDGELKQVGRQCLRDFLGHQDPNQIVSYLEQMGMFGDLEEYEPGNQDEDRASRGPRAFMSLPGYLSHVATMVRMNGWAPRSGSDHPTADQARTNYYNWLERRKDKRGMPMWEDPSEEDIAKAEQALHWARNELPQKDRISEYEHNLIALSRSDHVPERGEGYLASLIPAYMRAFEQKLEFQRREKISAASEHVGTIGERLKLKLTVEQVWAREGNYGTTYITKLVDENGNIFKWFGSYDLEQGKTYEATWRVKDHAEFRGAKETVLTRPTKLELLDEEGKSVETIHLADRDFDTKAMVWVKGGDSADGEANLIERMLLDGTRDEVAEALMQTFGLSRPAAEFMIAVELGHSDVVRPGEEGKDTWVEPYRRSDGVWVEGYWRGGDSIAFERAELREIVSTRDRETGYRNVFEDIEKAKGLIESVHAVPMTDQPRVWITVDDSLPLGTGGELYIQDKRVRGKMKNVVTGISMNPKEAGSLRYITVGYMVHELGHLLDIAAFGQGEKWASEVPLKGRKSIYEIARLANESKLVESLDRISQMENVRIQPWSGAPIFASKVSSSFGSFFFYLRQMNELFARAYVQWIALRTEDEDLMNYVRSFQGGTHHGAIEIPMHWRWDDFAPIAEAFDKAFAEHGFLKDDTIDSGERARSLARVERSLPKGVKGRIYVDPYLRGNERVSGYWREGGKSLEDIAEEAQQLFSEALRSRTKRGTIQPAAYQRSTGGYWKGPEGWTEIRNYRDGDVQFIRTVEYGEGEFASISVHGRHAGKRGEWKVTARAHPWNKAPIEFQRASLELQSFERDSRQESDELIKQWVEAKGWVRHGEMYMPRHGDWGVKTWTKTDEDAQGNRIFGMETGPSLIPDHVKKSRLEAMLDKDSAFALVKGQTSVQELSEYFGKGPTSWGWTFSPVDMDAGVYDLTFRKEGRMSGRGELEVKGYRLRFNKSTDLLEEIGLPTSISTEMGTEQDYKAEIEAEKARVRQVVEDHNDRVVAMATKLQKTLTAEVEPVVEPPTKAKMLENTSQIGVWGLAEGDRFVTGNQVYEIVESARVNDKPLLEDFDPEDFKPGRYGQAPVGGYSEGGYVSHKGSDFRIDKQGPQTTTIQSVKTGEKVDVDRLTFVTPLEPKTDVMARRVSGRNPGGVKQFPGGLVPDKIWQRHLALARMKLSESKEVQLARAADVFSEATNWDEVREALARSNFRLVKRNNRKGRGDQGGFTEVWKRPVTGSEVYIQVEPQGAPPPKELHVSWSDRPYPGVGFQIVQKSARIRRGAAEMKRERIIGRMPESAAEWKEDILGRAEEMAERYGETTQASVVVFAKSGDPNAKKEVPDMNAYIDGDGVIVLGVDVLPALTKYSEYINKGETPPDDVIRDAWSAWETAQHEINHSVNRAGGWFGGYSDHDGTKNFEETLTEELARVFVGDWMESQGRSELNEWAQNNAANPHVQGAYQLYRSNFKTLLDELGIPEDERMRTLERWKFHVRWQERMTELAQLVADHKNISIQDAKQELKERLSAKNVAGQGFTSGALRVQEFRPILEIGPMPPTRDEAEIALLRAEMEPVRQAFLAKLAEVRALRAEFTRLDAMVPSIYASEDTRVRWQEARAAFERAREEMKEIRSRYIDALEERNLVPPEEDYA